MGRTLDGYPTWSQNADPDPTQGADPFAVTDCGEECCSIIQFALGLGYTTETQVRERMPGHSGHGETSAADIADYLEGVGCRVLHLAAAGESLQMLVKAYISIGAPVVLLGNWVSPNVLHWVIAIGYGNDHLLYLDPWDGRMKAIHWSSARTLYKGSFIGVGKA